MTYRSWKFEDILKISELEKECFSDPWTYRMFVEGFSSKLFYGVCAVEDGEIVGYACETVLFENCLLYTSPSPRDRSLSRMPSSA